MQNFLNFTENNLIMEKQLISTSEKIRQANEAEVVLSLHQKVYKCKLAIGKVTKNANNPHFKKSYADLNAIIEAVEPILLENGLLLLQPIHGNSVCTQIIDVENGDKVESSLTLPIISDPQKLIASITYYRRGSLQSLLSLQAIDDDGNTAREAVKETKTFPQDRFQAGLDRVGNGEITSDEFKKVVSAFTLTEVQTKAMLLL